MTEFVQHTTSKRHVLEASPFYVFVKDGEWSTEALSANLGQHMSAASLVMLSYTCKKMWSWANRALGSKPSDGVRVVKIGTILDLTRSLGFLQLIARWFIRHEMVLHFHRRTLDSEQVFHNRDSDAILHMVLDQEDVADANIMTCIEFGQTVYCYTLNRIENKCDGWKCIEMAWKSMGWESRHEPYALWILLNGAIKHGQTDALGMIQKEWINESAYGPFDKVLIRRVDKAFAECSDEDRLIDLERTAQWASERWGLHWNYKEHG